MTEKSTGFICTKCSKATMPKIKRKRKRLGRSMCCNARWVMA